MIIIWILAIIGVILILAILLNIFKNWHTMMNYKNLFISLSIGTLAVSLLFIFLSISFIIKAILCAILVIICLFYGAFKKS